MLLKLKQLLLVLTTETCKEKSPDGEQLNRQNTNMNLYD